MKYIILVPDGMSGEPLEELAGKTCMEAAGTPFMDSIARKGVSGLVNNVPPKMVPASDVANLSILGYDPEKYYCGRGPLEASNLGFELKDNQVAFRYNLVTVFDGIMSDYSAGHITTSESEVLAKHIDEKIGGKKFKFYPGCSYRNLMIANCKDAEEANKLASLNCHAPHDILDKPIKKFMPDNAEIADMINSSKSILENHDINNVRVDLGQNPGNMIWLWGQGKKPNIPSFSDAYGLSGGIISAVDLIKGMGKVLKFYVAEVPGATGYYYTNYLGKAEYALKILETHDLVFVHVEAPDEAGHNGDIRAKITAIENFDQKIVGTILKAFAERNDYRVLVLPDHPTPVKKRTHTRDAVPFAMAGNGIVPDDVTVFSEAAAAAGSIKLKKGHELMKKFIK
ncbi:MAG: cofactor-independent phosphoglycerate mutase [Candidatus Omnitrophica bacterium]|nr:cofactor-independent phosphoglycerate mutase [Candidatus Omnitrophota bacterium]